MFKQLMIPGNRLPLIQRRSFHPVNVAVLCCVAFLAATTPALAQWGSVGGGGSTGVYNGQGYERSDDSYGSARSYPLASTASAGPTRRLALRAHDYHAARRASRQNGGYGSTGGYGSSGGYGSTGGYGRWLWFDGWLWFKRWLWLDWLWFERWLWSTAMVRAAGEQPIVSIKLLAKDHRSTVHRLQVIRLQQPPLPYCPVDWRLEFPTEPARWSPHLTPRIQG